MLTRLNTAVHLQYGMCAGGCGGLLTERVATTVGAAAQATHIPVAQAKALLKVSHAAALLLSPR